MLQLTRPSPPAIQRLISAQSGLPFSYDAVGATKGEIPAGWRVDHNRIELGRGAPAYEKARAALDRWAMFDSSWTSILPAGAPIEEGTTVVVLARTLGLSSANLCRIVYREDTDGSDNGIRRHGFAYGTLPHHVARGEERFLVEHHLSDDTVHFDVLAFSRPAHWTVKLGYPIMRACQRRFARDAKAAMVRAMVTS